MDEKLNEESSNHERETSIRRSDVDCQIDQSLRLAMLSYAARWLPLVMKESSVDKEQYEEMLRAYWRATRKDMLKVINRVAYRSVVTLYLFGQTPIPVGISEDEELDGITGVLCVQRLSCKFNSYEGSYGAASSTDRRCQHGRTQR